MEAGNDDAKPSETCVGDDVVKPNETCAGDNHDWSDGDLYEEVHPLISAIPACSIIFVGNPGVGKSTLLNCLCGQVLFKAGVTFGGGMTTGLDTRQVGEHTLMDTPGLSDIELRKQAAEAITKALRQGGSFKIFFVVTLESGRVRPADVTTMQLVLESAPIHHFGVILNKLSKAVMKKLHNDSNQTSSRKGLQAMILSQIDTQASCDFFFNKNSPDLEDEDDVLVPLSPEIVEFIASLIPTQLEIGAAREINESEFDALHKRHEEQIAAMQRDTDLLREQVDISERQAQRIQRQYEESQRQYEESRRQYEARINEDAREKEELKDQLGQLKQQFQHQAQQIKRQARATLQKITNGPEDPFELLGLSKQCSMKDATAKWKLLQVELHPDKNLPELKDEATAAFQKAQRAFESVREQVSFRDAKAA